MSTYVRVARAIPLRYVAILAWDVMVIELMMMAWVRKD